MSGECMPKEEELVIKEIQQYCLEATNMTESEAYEFAFRCKQLRFRSDAMVPRATCSTEEERLSIEEVIAHCDRNVDFYHKMMGKEFLESMSTEEINSVSCGGKEYWEHRQVASWLRELQQYRSKSTD